MVRIVGLVFTLAMIVGAIGCGKTTAPRTEVMASVDAEAGVRSKTVHLKIVVRSGKNEKSLSERYNDIFPDKSGNKLIWPSELALVPQEGDEDHVYEVTATALNAKSKQVAMVRAISGYVKGNTVLLRLLLEDECLDEICGKGLTCRGGDCVDASVEVDDLPRYTPNAEGGGGSGGKSGATDAAADGGGTNADGGASATLSEACMHYAEATCEFGIRCNNEYIIHSYGTLLADCIDAYSHGMECEYAERLLGLPGSNIKPSTFDDCTAALRAASCDSTDDPYLTCFLFPPGDVANGYPCASGYQCSSSNCEDVSSSTCGTCAPPSFVVTRGQIGDACDWVTETHYVDCADDTSVICKDGVCTATASLGKSCSDAKPCAPTHHLTDPQLLCEKGVCVGYGVEGMPCLLYESTHYCRNGFYCKASTNTCTENRHIKIGQSCKPRADEVVDCPEGWCPCADTDNPDPVCLASPHDGEPCVTSKCGAPSSQRGCAPGLNCGADNTCEWQSSPLPPAGCSGS